MINIELQIDLHIISLFYLNLTTSLTCYLKLNHTLFSITINKDNPVNLPCSPLQPKLT